MSKASFLESASAPGTVRSTETSIPIRSVSRQMERSVHARRHATARSTAASGQAICQP